MKGVHFCPIHRSGVVKTRPSGDCCQRARRAWSRPDAHVTGGDDGRLLGEDCAVSESLILHKSIEASRRYLPVLRVQLDDDTVQKRRGRI